MKYIPLRLLHTFLKYQLHIYMEGETTQGVIDEVNWTSITKLSYSFCFNK